MKLLHILNGISNLLWKLFLAMLFIVCPIGLTVYFYLYEETGFGMAIGQALLFTFLAFASISFLVISIYLIINSFNNKDPLIKEEAQDGILGFAFPVVILPVGWIIISQLDFISSDLKMNIFLWSLILFIIVFLGYVFYKSINDPLVNKQKVIANLVSFFAIVSLIGFIALVIYRQL